MLVIVCYDVNTETREGRRRLRRVAKICEGRGQRVQKSVFECQVDRAQFEALERSLVEEIKVDEDNLRFYRICARSKRSASIAPRQRGAWIETRRVCGPRIGCVGIAPRQRGAVIETAEH